VYDPRFFLTTLGNSFQKVVNFARLRKRRAFFAGEPSAYFSADAKGLFLTRNL
jgi:hypothetical protein